MSAVRIMTASRTYGELPAAYDDLTGRRFGHLTAVRPVMRRAGGRRRVCWECKCDCGGWTVRTADSLRERLHPERAHCPHCDGGPRIDWDAVLDEQRSVISRYRQGRRHDETAQ